MSAISAARVARLERCAKAVELRKSRKSLRAIAEILGCGHETVRRDLNGYLRKLDAACLEGTAALRAELAEEYDEIIAVLSREVLDNGNLDRVGDLLKATQELRKLYAVDVQPLGRSELQLRRAVITEIATKLRDQLPPEVFAEVATCLTNDEPVQLLDGVAIANGDAQTIEPPQSLGSRPRPAQGTDAAGGQQLDA